MNQFLKHFERLIVILLILIMVLIIILATLDLGWQIIQDILSSPVLLLDVSELLDLFGFVLLILIGIELLETIKAYLSEHWAELPQSGSYAWVNILQHACEKGLGGKSWYNRQIPGDNPENNL